ncbi:Lnb N-terminal periplasmic domain-containing protein [Hydrogenivirga sp.]
MQLCRLLLTYLFLVLLCTPSVGGGLSKTQKAVWHLLLHFKEGESTIDDPDFFLSPREKENPEAELQATLRAFKEKPKLRCRFPARAHFLEKYMKVELPSVRCPELERFLGELKGKRLSIVFADSHINSPASMFGHTFLRIYEKERDLYSYIANYAAKVDDSNAFLYAFKGLFGYYKGVYSVAPFYAKVREYSGIEGRDLWEYELDISEENLRLLKLHLWELRNTYAYYYFFHENCSSEVFYLLNFTEPESRLELETPWTVPVDTVKVLVEEGRVKRIDYEPSILTRLKVRRGFLSEEEVELIKGWIRGNKKLPPGKSHHLYEFASDYARFLYYGRSLDQETYRRKFLEALRLRSKAGRGEEPEFRGTPPHTSHDSQRAYLSAGLENEEPFLDLAYRPVYHDLLDRPQGYKENAEIVFSEVALRFFPGERKLLLNRWSMIRITSLEPVLSFYRPMSWKVDFGVYRFTDERDRRKSYLLLNSGGGYTFGLGGMSLFFLPEVRLLARREFVAGGGLQVGTLVQGKRLSLLSSGSAGRYILGFGREEYVYLKGGLAFHVPKNVSLRLEGSYEKVGGGESGEVSLSALLYF